MAWENNLGYGRLQWAGHIIRVDECCIPTKALQQAIHSKIRVKRTLEKVGRFSKRGSCNVTWHMGLEK
jgi:hypothetical protein